MIDDYALDKVLAKIERIGIKKYHTRILIDPYDKLPDDISLRSAVILMTGTIIKDDDKCYSQLFLEEGFYGE